MDTPRSVLSLSRETTWAIITLVVAVHGASSLFVNAVVFQEPTLGFLRGVSRATGGLVAVNLMTNLLPLALVVGLCMAWAGGLRPREFAWRKEDLGPALAITVVLWVVLHLTVAAYMGWHGADLGWSPAIRDGRTRSMLGGFLGQAAGNALVEETVFRAFLYPQLYFKLRRRLKGRASFVAAALASQVVFALLHLPNRVFVKGMSGPELGLEQLILVAGGLIFLGVWLVSGNLWLAVGFHAVSNRPSLLLTAPPGPTHAAWMLLVVLFIASWRSLVRTSPTRRFARTP